MEKKILYIKNSKTGSEFIADILRSRVVGNVHVTPQEISYSKSQFDDRKNNLKLWKDTYPIKITSVRNPYARCVSIYRWLMVKSPLDRTNRLKWITNKNDKKEGFKQFINKSFNDLQLLDNYAWDVSLPTSTLCSIDGDISFYDKIIRCESLEEDLLEVFNKFTLGTINFNKKYSINGSGKYDLMDYYDEENKQLVYEKYKKDFELFSYDKESIKV